MPEGTTIEVAAGDVFFGVGGASVVRLAPGTHKTLLPCDRGLFVREEGCPCRPGGRAGAVYDRQTGARQPSIYLDCVVRIEDAVALAAWVDDEIDEALLMRHVGMTVVKTASAILDERFEDGTWSVSAIESGALGTALVAEIEKAYPAADGAHGTAITIGSLTVTFSPAEPREPRADAALTPGARVLVRWADGHRYPALVQQQGAGQYLVSFSDGRTQWVALDSVSPA